MVIFFVQVQLIIDNDETVQNFCVCLSVHELQDVTAQMKSVSFAILIPFFQNFPVKRIPKMLTGKHF